MKTLLVACIIAFAHFVETSTGFGATVIAVALAAHFIPIKTLVVALVLIAWLQSAWIIARSFRHIRWDVFLGRILPLTALGLPFGIWCFRALATDQLQTVLGLFVVAVAVLELVRFRSNGRAVKPLAEWKGLAVLFGGGLFHGMFASGGPLVVYYAARKLDDKRSFRATLSLLWIVLNSAMIASYALSGRLDVESISLAATLIPPFLIGVVAGEILHARINELAFRRFVYVVLLLTGVSFIV